MKGIVVEKNEDSAVVLSDDGIFVNVRNHNYEVGRVINMENGRKISSKMIAGLASIAAALVICTIGGFAYFTPTGYVSLDVNPSIEYSVNMFDRILDVKAVNEDGAKIISTLDLKNMTIEDAVKTTLDKLISEGYLVGDEDGGVVITTSNSDDVLAEAETLAANLKVEIQEYLDAQEGVIAEVEAEAVGLARVEEARKMGVTPGKLNLVEKLQASTTGAIDVEEWLDMPVKDINKAIKENRELEKEKSKDLNDDDEDADTEINDDADDNEDDSDIDDDSDKNNKDKDSNENKDNNANKEKEEIQNENTNDGATLPEEEQEKVKNENASEKVKDTEIDEDNDKGSSSDNQNSSSDKQDSSSDKQNNSSEKEKGNSSKNDD